MICFHNIFWKTLHFILVTSVKIQAFHSETFRFPITEHRGCLGSDGIPMHIPMVITIKNNGGRNLSFES